MLIDALDTILSNEQLEGVKNSTYNGLVKDDYNDLK